MKFSKFIHATVFLVAFQVYLKKYEKLAAKAQTGANRKARNMLGWYAKISAYCLLGILYEAYHEKF